MISLHNFPHIHSTTFYVCCVSCKQTRTMIQQLFFNNIRFDVQFVNWIIKKKNLSPCISVWLVVVFFFASQSPTLYWSVRFIHACRVCYSSAQHIERLYFFVRLDWCDITEKPFKILKKTYEKKILTTWGFPKMGF